MSKPSNVETAEERLRALTTAFDSSGSLVGMALREGMFKDLRDNKIVATALLLQSAAFKRPTMVPVPKSSNIVQIGYDAVWRELWVRFKDGSLYVYIEVPSVTHEGLMAADSAGGFLHKEIKGRFEYKKVE